MDSSNNVAAIFQSHDQAEVGIHTLAKAGFDMKKLSIIGKDYRTEEQPLAYFNTGERVKFFGKLGAFWGALVGMLFGSALMFVPVIGHIVVLGPLAATLAGALQGVILGGGFSALFGALTSLGIPKDSVIRYQTAVKADKFLVIIHSKDANIKRAKEILTESGGADIEAHLSR